MTARIYRPAKTAMQSGMARTKDWVLEFDASSALSVEPLMGWTSNSDTSRQVRLTFASKDDAVAYARARGLAFTLVERNVRKPVAKSYANNFQYGRRCGWTH